MILRTLWLLTLLSLLCNGCRKAMNRPAVVEQNRSFTVSADQGKSVAIRLIGPTGNPTATGARVELTLSNGQKLVQETYSGIGYLTQGSSKLFFALGSSSVKTLRVRWPDGTTTDTVPDKTDMILIRHVEQNVGQQ